MTYPGRDESAGWLLRRNCKNVSFPFERFAKIPYLIFFLSFCEKRLLTVLEEGELVAGDLCHHVGGHAKRLLDHMHLCAGNQNDRGMHNEVIAKVIAMSIRLFATVPTPVSHGQTKYLTYLYHNQLLSFIY